MATPSQARMQLREGVETRRAAPKPRLRNGEGMFLERYRQLAVTTLIAAELLQKDFEGFVFLFPAGLIKPVRFVVDVELRIA